MLSSYKQFAIFLHLWKWRKKV